MTLKHPELFNNEDRNTYAIPLWMQSHVAQQTMFINMTLYFQKCLLDFMNVATFLNHPANKDILKQPLLEMISVACWTTFKILFPNNSIPWIQLSSVLIQLSLKGSYITKMRVLKHRLLSWHQGSTKWRWISDSLPFVRQCFCEYMSLKISKSL